MPTDRTIIKAITTYPGLRCHEIAEALGCAPAHLSIELKRLRIAGSLRRVGNTRGTKWYPRKSS